MPWQKQFDVEETLSRAMDTFWMRGYEATSMRDLVGAMGINRASIYATFGDKRELFLRALQHYDQNHRRTWLTAITETNPPKEAILTAFEAAARQALTEGRRDGCFLVNTALELSPHDDEIAAVVAHGLTETERFLKDNIDRAQKAGSVPQTVDPIETARSLLGLFIGLRVLSRSRPEQPLLQSIVKQAEALLN